jgi:hypothetical protein
LKQVQVFYKTRKAKKPVRLGWQLTFSGLEICVHEIGARNIKIIQFNSSLFCAESTATRPIRDTAQCRYR